MRPRLACAALAVATAGCGAVHFAPEPPVPAWSLAIHGGASNPDPGTYSDADRAAIRADLARALQAGAAVLESGGASLDAVQAAVVVLEDSPWFNAGKGAVFTRAGTNELDASIMDGATSRAGAVAVVRRVRNPIALARLVMERSPHVLMVGEGAEQFAREQGVALVDPAYFRTERRWRQLQEFLARERRQGDKAAAGDAYFGTVGAVARDRQGRLAAATSTGGLTGKRWGRVGDSPIIGAGTFADTRCAVSATGHGETFIRHAVAHDICARSRDTELTVAAAARVLVDDVLRPAGGEGGVVTIDDRGEPAHAFNTRWMARGAMVAGGAPRTATLADEPLAP